LKINRGVANFVIFYVAYYTEKYCKSKVKAAFSVYRHAIKLNQTDNPNSSEMLHFLKEVGAYRTSVGSDFGAGKWSPHCAGSLMST